MPNFPINKKAEFIQTVYACNKDEQKFNIFVQNPIIMTVRGHN